MIEIIAVAGWFLALVGFAKLHHYKKLVEKNGDLSDEIVDIAIKNHNRMMELKSKLDGERC